MQKFKHITTGPTSKPPPIRIIKDIPCLQRTKMFQLPKATSMRNLRPSPPRPTLRTLANLDKIQLKIPNQPEKARPSQRASVNHHIMAKPVKHFSKRFNTEQRETVYQKHVQSLKNYINELTFREEPQRRGTDCGPQRLNDALLAEQRKNFLMGQVSFTHIDEERVMAQKKYLERFEYLTKSLPRKKRESASGSNLQGSESRIFQCMRVIERIYGLLRQMEEAGYSLKDNRCIIHHCIIGKLWLKKVFLHESDQKRDAFTTEVKYLVNQDQEDTKMRFTEFASKKRGEELRVVQDELQGLYFHLEQSLAQKKVNQVSNVAIYIENRLSTDAKSLSRSLRLTTAPQDKMKLTQDLQGIEEKFGGMRSITKISRKRYDQLNRTYDKLQALL